MFLLILFISENVGSMSQDISRKETRLQEKLLQQTNSWLYNEYQTKSSHNSIGRIGPEAPLECYECNSIHDGENCYNFNKNDTSSQIDPRFKKQCPSDKPYCKVSFKIYNAVCLFEKHDPKVQLRALDYIRLLVHTK